MNSRFSRTKAVVILTGVVMVGLGIAILVNPIAAVQTLVRTMGWVLVAYGVITLVPAFLKGDPLHNSQADLVVGVLAVIPGLVMALFPAALIKFVWTLIGIIVLTTGVMDIFEAGSFRRRRSPLALPATVSGVITAALGVVVIVMPLASSTFAMFFAAIALLVDGITEVVFGLSM